MKFWLSFLFVIKLISASPTPIVMWHGMGDTCCLPFSLGIFKQFLQKNIKDVYVVSLMIGNSTIEDLESGYFMDPNKQVNYVCHILHKDPQLKKGFNAIGFSQGSQFLRAVIQRCGHKLPPIKNFISMGGQHQGVYGLPHCGALKHNTCDYMRKLLNYAAYHRNQLLRSQLMKLANKHKNTTINPDFVLAGEDRRDILPSLASFKRPELQLPIPNKFGASDTTWVQSSLVQATYWHDPLDEKTYKLKSVFLADINNERTINKTYINNLNKLEKFVLIKFDNDTIVQPRETEWFGFYAPGQAVKLMTLQESSIYTEDRLGLKQMDKHGKLVFLSQPGDHLRFSESWFLDKIIIPYLSNNQV